ncbi:MAG: hypothetical protein U5N58_01730 [Actinomycetota bacterium]|nr:hypothetical protein [Actinomycetota bacterium]
MASEGIRVPLPLYPENRRCRYPATARINEICFQILEGMFCLMVVKRIGKCFYDPISELQEQNS